MNNKETIALCTELVKVSYSLFFVLGGEEAQDFAIKIANNGYSEENFSEKEKLYYSLFTLSKCCNKIKRRLTESDDMFLYPLIKED